MTAPHTCFAAVACLAAVLVAGEAHGQEAAVHSEFDTSLSAGVELGNPTGVVVKVPLVGPLLGVGVGLGSGTKGGHGFLGHVDLLVTPLVLGEGDMTMPVHVGAGLHYYSHRYDYVSVDEVPDRHIGVRFPMGLGLRLGKLRTEIYAEVAPGRDLSKTSSCNLLSGTGTICPHDTDRYFFHFALGARRVF